MLLEVTWSSDKCRAVYKIGTFADPLVGGQYVNLALTIDAGKTEDREGIIWRRSGVRDDGLCKTVERPSSSDLLVGG